MPQDTTVAGLSEVTVRVTVSVTCGIWGRDCTIGQAYDQATREAESSVRALINKNHRMTAVSVESLQLRCNAEVLK